MNAQGEDVVAGIRTPLPIGELERENPTIYGQLVEDPPHAREALPRHAGHRVHHRAGHALHAAVPRRQAHRRRRRSASPSTWWTRSSSRRSEALLRVEPEQLNQLLRPIFDPAREGARRRASGRLLAQGPQRRARRRDRRIVFHAEDAEALAARGERVILVRIETSPEDIRGMDAARGHPHRARRHDQPRGARRAADGQGLRRRLRRAARSTTRPARCASPGSDARAARGRRPSRSTASPARSSAATSRPSRARSSGCSSTRHLDAEGGARLPAATRSSWSWADSARRLRVRANADQPDQAPARSPSAPRASASAAPSTCSSARARSARCAR